MREQRHLKCILLVKKYKTHKHLPNTIIYKDILTPSQKLIRKMKKEKKNFNEVNLIWLVRINICTEVPKWSWTIEVLGTKT